MKLENKMTQSVHCVSTMAKCWKNWNLQSGIVLLLTLFGSRDKWVTQSSKIEKSIRNTNQVNTKLNISREKEVSWYGKRLLRVQGELSVSSAKNLEITL